MIVRLVFALFLSAATAVAQSDEYISGRGSPVVAQILGDAIPLIKNELGVDFRAATDSASSQAIENCANGSVDLALSVRSVSAQERAAHPDKSFIETVIGRQALVIIVPDEIWDAGIKSLSRQQLVAIYEGDIKSWKNVGGPDRPITFFNRESAGGVWDLFVLFLYGDVRKAPLSKAEVINNPEEVKTAVQFGRGSFSVIEFGAYQPGQGVHALGLKQPNGVVIEPTLANIASGRYEIARPLLIITSKRPTGKLRELVEFMRTPKIQELVRKKLHIPITDLEPAKK